MKKTVLITGGSRGIGANIVQELSGLKTVTLFQIYQKMSGWKLEREKHNNYVIMLKKRMVFADLWLNFLEIA